MKHYKKYINWGISAIVIALVIFTDLPKMAMAKVQGAVLATGLIKPDLTETKQATAVNVKNTANFSVKNMQTNQAVSLYDLRGKVVFINFWATWCPPCVAEMPTIEKLYEKFKDNPKVAFLMVSFDKNPKAALKFMENKDYSLPVHVLSSALPAEFQSDGIPTTFVISPNGEIALRHVGMAQYDSPEFEAFLKELM